MFPRLALLFALLLASSPAAAWWEYGHYSVARVAQLEVKPATRAAIRRLIARSAELETPTCPIRTIEDASYWPDCVKTLGERFSYAFAWHYQNVDICKPFDLSTACKDGHCVSKQIERNFKLLADKTLPPRERLMALAFLVHFVGDLHQPLHAGDKGDRGGNDFKASYGVIPSNLHAIWDGYLADRGISTPPPDAAGIVGELTPAERLEMRGGTVDDWSRESWATAREFGYGLLMDDLCGPLPESRPTLDEARIRSLIPIIRRQVARGGLRLARLLDEALG
jgi:S1/P1 Nuclease